MKIYDRKMFHSYGIHFPAIDNIESRLYVFISQLKDNNVIFLFIANTITCVPSTRCTLRCDIYSFLQVSIYKANVVSSIYVKKCFIYFFVPECTLNYWPE